MTLHGGRWTLPGGCSQTGPCSIQRTHSALVMFALSRHGEDSGGHVVHCHLLANPATIPAQKKAMAWAQRKYNCTCCAWTQRLQGVVTSCPAAAFLQGQGRAVEWQPAGCRATFSPTAPQGCEGKGLPLQQQQQPDGLA